MFTNVYRRCFIIALPTSGWLMAAKLCLSLVHDSELLGPDSTGTQGVGSSICNGEIKVWRRIKNSKLNFKLID